MSVPVLWISGSLGVISYWQDCVVHLIFFWPATWDSAITTSKILRLPHHNQPKCFLVYFSSNWNLNIYKLEFLSLLFLFGMRCHIAQPGYLLYVWGWPWPPDPAAFWCWPCISIALCPAWEATELPPPSVLGQLLVMWIFRCFPPPSKWAIPVRQSLLVNLKTTAVHNGVGLGLIRPQNGIYHLYNITCFQCFYPKLSQLSPTFN